VNYSPNARLEDRLHPLEPPYRSRGEAQVGRLLDREQIPFLYEQPTLIYDRGRHRIWRPDFTLPTYGGLVVEYAGMMDVPDYAAGIEHKIAAYRGQRDSCGFRISGRSSRPHGRRGDILKKIESAAGYLQDDGTPPHEYRQLFSGQAITTKRGVDHSADSRS
jgi:hypothetical protein